MTAHLYKPSSEGGGTFCGAPCDGRIEGPLCADCLAADEQFLLELQRHAPRGDAPKPKRRKKAVK